VAGRVTEEPGKGDRRGRGRGRAEGRREEDGRTRDASGDWAKGCNALVGYPAPASTLGSCSFLWFSVNKRSSMDRQPRRDRRGAAWQQQQQQQQPAAPPPSPRSPGLFPFPFGWTGRSRP
jgi:hypothetical protein